jgi:import inner membrane translocase subunit TIM16
MALGGQIIRLLLQVVPVVMRALPAAYAKAIQNAAKNGGAAAAAGRGTTAATDLFRTKQMSKEEALQILNIEESDFERILPHEQQQQTPPPPNASTSSDSTNNIILERFEKYMNMNEVKRIPNSSYNTGSFYLQSKIYHAKETLMRELQRKQASSSSSSSSDQSQ